MLDLHQYATIAYYCAAGAISSECQRVRRRRSSLKSLLRELIGSLRTHFFELLAGVEPFSRSKTGTREPTIGPKSCPLFAVVVKKITEHFWTSSMELNTVSTRKSRSKRGFLSECGHRTRPLLETPMRSSTVSVAALRLRRNLPRGFILV